MYSSDLKKTKTIDSASLQETQNFPILMCLYE